MIGAGDLGEVAEDQEGTTRQERLKQDQGRVMIQSPEAVREAIGIQVSGIEYGTRARRLRDGAALRCGPTMHSTRNC